MLFLTESGGVAGCEANVHGQLGDGTREATSLNTKVGPVFTNLTGIAWVSGGWSASAAIGVDGSIWTWGKTENGISGTGFDGANEIYNTSPVKLNFNAGSSLDYPPLYAGTQSSSIYYTSIHLGMAPASSHVRKNGRLFLAALLPDGTLMLMNESGQFQPYSSSSMPFFYEGILPKQYPLYFPTADYSVAKGVKIILGYGVGVGNEAVQDMLENSRYSYVITLN